MNPSCLDFALTSRERAAFERDGLLLLENALSPARVESLTRAVDRLADGAQKQHAFDLEKRLDIRDLLWRDPLFLDLVDWPTTLPKVWGILGWNIQIYHTLYMQAPPAAAAEEKVRFLGWHRDTGQLNRDLETHPQPRISVKVAFFLSDCSSAGRANFWAIPGSHVQERIEKPEDGSAPTGAQPLLVPAGAALLFDRRLWHASSSNHSEITRKVLFYGYSYRWLRPRDEQSVEELLDKCDPIRRQLLGHSPNGGYGYTSPADEDVPLRGWLRQHLGEDGMG